MLISIWFQLSWNMKFSFFSLLFPIFVSIWLFFSISKFTFYHHVNVLHHRNISWWYVCLSLFWYFVMSWLIAEHSNLALFFVKEHLIEFDSSIWSTNKPITLSRLFQMPNVLSHSSFTQRIKKSNKLHKEIK